MHAYSILNLSIGTQILEHEETTQLSPSTIRKVTAYESRRRFDLSGNSSRSTSELVNTSSSYDESGWKVLSPESMSTSSDTGDGYVMNF
jgi:hypothetical protein